MGNIVCVIAVKTITGSNCIIATHTEDDERNNDALGIILKATLG